MLTTFFKGETATQRIHWFYSLSVLLCLALSSSSAVPLRFSLDG